MKDKIAQIVRIVTVPPVLIFFMLLILICMILYGIEFWASIRLKRHTISEFIAGSLTALVAFGSAALHFGFY